MALTNKQRVFIDEYLKHFNATRAAIDAGYSPQTAYNIGWENVRKREIAEAISRRLSESAMGPDEVLMRLAEQARNEHGRYIDEAGSVNLPMLIADGKGHLIKGIKETQYGRNIEFYDAQAALVHIGKHHKLFTDKVEHSGRIEHSNVTDLTDEELANIASRRGGGTAQTQDGAAQST